MKGIVIIPCWQRPDFLLACLRYIQAAKGWEDYFYLFCLDRGHSKEVLRIVNEFEGKKFIQPHVHRYNGNSYNVLEGFRWASEWLKENGGICHLIEEDIFIGPGFFDFHEKAWAEDPGAFFVSACYNQNHERTSEDTEAIYRHQSYQSLGVSMKATSLDKFLPHANEKYYRSMGSYIRLHLKTRLGQSCHEQDGMIHRVILLENAYGVYPEVPRAFHAGFKGYNRPGKVLDATLSISERADRLMKMTEVEMNQRATNLAHKDIRRCRMDYFEPETLKLRT